MRLSPTRDRVGSILQSAVEEMLHRQGHAGRPTLAHPAVLAASVAAAHLAEGRPVPREAPSHLAQDARDAWECIHLAGRLLAAHARGDPAAVQAARDDLAYSECDPGWMEVIIDHLPYASPSAQIPYVRHASMDDFVLPILPQNARVALLGDWGTGTPIAKALLEEIARHHPDALVHLGDVYYAATPREMQQHFLGLIDEVFPRSQGRVPVYTLCGNHDLYSGGAGYYGTLPLLNPAPSFPPEAAQRASYFSLRTKDGAWQLLAMDTGLHDRDPARVNETVTWLESDEEAWHADKVTRFEGRTILLSHHPAFSAFSAIGEYAKRDPPERAINPRLMRSYAAIAAGGDVAAWFWGHEHNLGVYAPYAGIARGRCVGHAGVPALVADEPYRVLSELRDPPTLVRNASGAPLQLGHDEDAYQHGYVMLELDDASRRATARYYVVGQDAPIHEETF